MAKYLQENDYGVKNGPIAPDIESMKESGAALGRHIKEDTYNMAKSAKAAMKKGVGNISSRMGTYRKDVEKMVQNKPLQSIGIALAVGAILSLLLKRR